MTDDDPQPSLADELAATYLDDGFEDEDAWLDAWDAAGREAGAFLREHLAEHRHAASPHRLVDAGTDLRHALLAGDPDATWMRRAAGIEEDLCWPGGAALAAEDLIYDLVAASIEPREDPGMSPEEQASLMTLEYVDWLGAIIELVRRGPGAAADADALARYSSTCPDIEGEPVDPDEVPVLAAGFEVALRGWRVAGVVDRDDRFTDVGSWLLPRAASFAWGTDFDHPDDDVPFGDGPAGDDADALDGGAVLAELAEIHDLDARGAESLSLLLTIHQGAVLGAGDALEDRMVADAATAALDEPGVAAAFAVEALGIGRQTEDADGVERVAEVVLRHARGRRAAPAHYLLARVAEVRGDPKAGRAALERALQFDGDLEPALEDAAWYAEDQGEPREALRLLRRLGVDHDDPQLRRMEEFLTVSAPPSGVGRNDPCPCGSGRKFKVCCLRSPGSSVADRLGFVLSKLDVYVRRPAQRVHVLGLALAAAGTDEEAIVARLHDVMISRLAVFDGSLFADFLRDRGPLLPADERTAMTGWSDVRAGVYEVVGVTPGEGLTLLDLRSDVRTDVDERTSSRTLEVGTCLLAHVLPIGEVWKMGAAMIIPDDHRQSLVERLAQDPSATAIATWIGETRSSGPNPPS